MPPPAPPHHHPAAATAAGEPASAKRSGWSKVHHHSSVAKTRIQSFFQPRHTPTSAAPSGHTATGTFKGTAGLFPGLGLAGDPSRSEHGRITIRKLRHVISRAVKPARPAAAAAAAAGTVILTRPAAAAKARAKPKPAELRAVVSSGSGASRKPGRRPSRPARTTASRRPADRATLETFTDKAMSDDDELDEPERKSERCHLQYRNQYQLAEQTSTPQQSPHPPQVDSDDNPLYAPTLYQPDTHNQGEPAPTHTCQPLIVPATFPTLDAAVPQLSSPGAEAYRISALALATFLPPYLAVRVRQAAVALPSPLCTKLVDVILSTSIKPLRNGHSALPVATSTAFLKDALVNAAAAKGLRTDTVAALIDRNKARELKVAYGRPVPKVRDGSGPTAAAAPARPRGPSQQFLVFVDAAAVRSAAAGLIIGIGPRAATPLVPGRTARTRPPERALVSHLPQLQWTRRGVPPPGSRWEGRVGAAVVRPGSARPHASARARLGASGRRASAGSSSSSGSDGRARRTSLSQLWPREGGDREK